MSDDRKNPAGSLNISGRSILPDDIVHLPAAPQLAGRTRFSPPPPGTNQCLGPQEAFEFLERRMEEKAGKVAMAAITGPGDPLATPGKTFTLLETIKKRYPSLPLGLRSMGIGSAGLAGRLAQAGVVFMEMQVEAVAGEILEKLFAWIRPGAKTVKLRDGVAVLLREQRNGVPALRFHDISVAIATTLYPGFNIDHVGRISSEMMELGAGGISLLPYRPAIESEVRLEQPSEEEMAMAAGRAGAFLPVVPSLFQRETGIGQGRELQGPAVSPLPKASKKRPYAAVVSSNGIEVDLHLGRATRFLIYGYRSDGLLCLLESRRAPEAGTGTGRWHQAAETLKDCFVLLAGDAGESPRNVLGQSGVRVHITDANIEGIIEPLFGEGKKKT